MPINNTEIENVTETKEKLERPRKYSVVFHNDDFTPMEFVIELLMLIFNKSPQAAMVITEEVHLKGKAIVGEYPKSIAQSKVNEVTEAAKQNEFPLKCTMEAN